MSLNSEDLNYDFNYNMFLAKNAISNLPKCEDRQKVVRWMRKLASSNRTVQEMKLRNDFMYYLISNIQRGFLEAPFTDHPPTSPLPNISNLLPGVGVDDPDVTFDNKDGTGGKMPMLYENSPDGGAFLAAQPVPRCGAFCYLAVVARNPKE
ncbi:uncharacterized protein LOC109596028 [Aethina tumida]|uniref:uncharacterized protein LOC109596028 n=1 Tax=Aethina tumida TaxID=116153 RepID=UPI00096B377B|nr:uncharacterized protein LOC109596028 [Aethina tumida]